MPSGLSVGSFVGLANVVSPFGFLEGGVLYGLGAQEHLGHKRSHASTYKAQKLTLGEDDSNEHPGQ